MPSTVTLKMIAEKAGTTVATVSMALRHHHRISQATRQRIQQLADEMGYQVNPAVTALMSHVRRSRPMEAKETLAVIHSFPTRDDWRNNEPTRRAVVGIETRGRQLGYRIEIFWYNEPDINPDRLAQILRARGIRGIIFVPWPMHLLDLKFDWKEFSAATINYNVTSPALHCAAEDFFGNVRLAIDELWRRGFRRIGFVSKRYHEPESNYRLAAAYTRFLTLREDRSLPDPEVLIMEDWNREKFHIRHRDIFLAWHKKEKCEAIITLDWDVGRWLPAAGIKVPDKVSVLLLNQCPRFGHFSGIDPNYEMVGAAAMDLVAEQITNNESGLPYSPKEVLAHGRWAEGKMVRTAKK